MASVRFCQTGFTLLELLVAMLLTSLLTLVVYGSLNLSLKGMGRTEAAAAQLQQARISQTILERTLGSTVRYLQPGDHKHFFLGEAQNLRFYTLVPLEAHSLGGIYHFRAFWGKDENGKGCLAVEQTRSMNWRRDPEGVETRQILLRGLADLRFTFGRGNEEVKVWDAEAKKRLPEWVKVTITPIGRDPVVWFIPIHTAEQGTPPQR